ncbi:beta-amyrin 6-beta-monooxygenase [Daucus carota subsp. sativus]
MNLHTLAMTLFPYIFALLLILSISVFLVWMKQSGHTNMKVPPGSCGWPVVGESFRYVSLGTQHFISEKRKKYSTDVFKTSIFGQKMAVFCGAQGNKFVFTKLITSWWPVTVKKILFSPEFSHTPLDETSAAMHRFVHEILKPEALKNYVPVMDAMAREHVESDWDGNEVVKVHPLSKKYTFELAYRLFVKEIDVEQVTRIFKHFALVTSGMFSVPINLPGTAYSRGVKGGKLIREELVKIIKKWRQEMMEKNETSPSYTDSLSRMLLVTDENGKFMSEKEMSNYIIALLIGSYESTSTAVSFVLKYLAELPHIYDEVYKELMEIAKSKREGELLTWEDIQKMRYSWNVVCESLRLMPPVQGGFREVVSDVSFSGFTIPKGYKASWTAYTTHKDPEYFPDPEKFDPSRYEGNGPAIYTYVPFGGGARMCCGKEYARLEVLVFIYNIVTRFRLEIINPQDKIVFHSFPIPMEGLPLRIIRHNI